MAVSRSPWRRPRGPSGRFAWNAWALDHHVAADLDGASIETPVPHTINYFVSDNRMEVTLADGSKSVFWWASRNEWLGLVDIAGLEVEALYGSFDREPLTESSRENVFVTRLRLDGAP